MNVCFSGGAQGADLHWGAFAAKLGHQVIHFGFEGHRNNAPPGTYITLTKEELRQADPFLEVANKTLKRKIPTDQFIKNLLRRNYYQILHSNALYAVSEIDRNGLVKGGTAWAVVMFENQMIRAPLYVYDQNRQQWYSRDRFNNVWVEIDRPPTPSGAWTGIGTRKLNEFGKLAIDGLNQMN